MDTSEIYRTAQIETDKEMRVARRASEIIENMPRYKYVAARSSVPDFCVGIIHSLESSLNFSCHLHNGDSLSNRTIHVPTGRPKSGTPPFTWEESAIDALKGVWVPCNWAISEMLEFFERYNGLGYRKHHVPSPYVWACTNAYKAGLFTSDGTFDQAAVSNNIGAAALLKAIAFLEPATLQ